VFNPKYGSNCISYHVNLKDYNTNEHIRCQSPKIYQRCVVDNGWVTTGVTKCQTSVLRHNLINESPYRTNHNS